MESARSVQKDYPPAAQCERTKQQDEGELAKDRRIRVNRVRRSDPGNCRQYYQHAAADLNLAMLEQLRRRARHGYDS